jgi:hypothetical protein
MREGDCALLRVRSVLVPETYNVLIDPRPADAARIKRLAVMRIPSILGSWRATSFSVRLRALEALHVRLTSRLTGR